MRREGKTGAKASYNKVARHMRTMGLNSIHNRRRQRSLTDSRNARDDGYPNLVRGLEITEPFQVITSDITYIKTGEGFEYLCKVKDVLSGVVLGENMMDNMKAELVVQAIKNTMKRWHLPKGTIFHSDRGSQYTSASVKELLRKHGLCQSYSRVHRKLQQRWNTGARYKFIKRTHKHPECLLSLFGRKSRYYEMVLLNVSNVQEVMKKYRFSCLVVSFRSKPSQ